MARRKRKNQKKNRLRQFIIVGASLSVIQMAFLVLVGGFNKQQVSVKTVIDSAVNNADNIKMKDKKRVKVQLALADYRRQNGAYPGTLSLLVPDYFDTTPVDPETNEVFRYEKKGVGYRLGTEIKAQSAVAALMKNRVDASTDLIEKKITQDDQTIFLAMLDKDMAKDDFVYDPAGKRDPFKSFDFSPKSIAKSGGTPLECCDYNDLKIVAILNFGKPKVSIETPDGQGHLVKKGDVVGPYGGKIVKIEDDKITVLETTENFSGDKETRTVEMFLR